MVGKLIAILGKRQHWVQGFAALLIFGSGLIVGSAGTFAVLKGKINIEHPPIFDDGFVEFLIRDWQPKYQLDDQQVEQVREVMVEQSKAFREIYQAAEKQSKDLEKPWLEKMKKIMTAEQYAQWFKDYEERKQWRRDRRGPGGRRGRRDEQRDGRDDRGGPRREGREGPGGPPPDGMFGPPPDRERGPEGPPPEELENSEAADPNRPQL